jgi:NAD(P)-dependent dehydrogenase (short-subunit alcohol dehydrogenase family)
MNEENKAPHLQDKKVVVLGASRGLGRAIVAAASALGAQVLAVARSTEPLTAFQYGHRRARKDRGNRQGENA